MLFWNERSLNAESPIVISMAQERPDEAGSPGPRCNNGACKTVEYRNECNKQAFSLAVRNSAVHGGAAQSLAQLGAVLQGGLGLLEVHPGALALVHLGPLGLEAVNGGLEHAVLGLDGVFAALDKGAQAVVDG